MLRVDKEQQIIPCVKLKAPGPSVVPAAKLNPIDGLHV